jgi:hypothetical protein
MSPFPAILIPAEALGLATRRSGNGYQCNGGLTADDLDALDTVGTAQFDCNGNGVEDALDILAGEPDANRNGLPDSCEPCGQVVTYCTAGTTSSGCNPTLSASGTPSLSNAAPFVLAAGGLEGNKNGIFFYGISGRAAAPWGNSTSWLCVKAPSQRMSPPAGSGGTSGACDGNLTRDWNGYVAANPNKPINLALAVGTTVDAQLWFRDPLAATGPVGSKGTAMSSAIEFVVCP